MYSFTKNYNDIGPRTKPCLTKLTTAVLHSLQQNVLSLYCRTIQDTFKLFWTIQEKL